MDDQLTATIRQKLGLALEFAFPGLTERDARLPSVPGKAHAVIGMRRSGKTWYLYQCLKERMAAGTPRDRLIYFNFEDERLADLKATDLGLLIEEYYRVFPAYRGRARVTFCFDEIQAVAGWERFVRRLLDEELVEVFLSGSSARLLSREVATSMRGRAMETIITPFSFREFLAHRGESVSGNEGPVGPRQRSGLLAALDAYLETGGFPEAQAVAEEQDRVSLLQGYVDAVLFRDVVERHGIGNVPALRALVRQLLRNPARTFSVSKLYSDFRSRGIAVSKETLLAYVSHLEDSFLLTPVSLHTSSERRSQVAPRKLYLADHSLATAFAPRDPADRGHRLENIVACDLLRRHREVFYCKTRSGHEIDFRVQSDAGRESLIQVAADISSAATLARELKAFDAAAAEYPDAELLLVSEVPEESAVSTPGGTPVRLIPLWRFLLRG